MSTRKPMSPVNIEQNREVGIDTPLDGSRMGREADKASGDPGERGHDAPRPMPSARGGPRKPDATARRPRHSTGGPMADDPKKTALDRKLIALHEPHEVRSWTESLGCSETQLRDAVKAVGNSADEVRQYLAEKLK